MSASSILPDPPKPLPPTAIVDLYGGELATLGDDYRAAKRALAGMAAADVRQTVRLAPKSSRLRRLAEIEIEMRANRASARALAARVLAPVRPRTARVEEL